MQKTVVPYLFVLVVLFCHLKASADSYDYYSLNFSTFSISNEQNNAQSKRQRIPQKQRYVYGEYNNGVLSIYFSNDEGMATVSVFDLSGNLTYYTTISTSYEETISTTLAEGYSIHIITDLGNEYLTTIY